VRAGDVVWIAPDEKHWHGAGPNTTMVHIAIHEARDGTYVDWLERVTDEQFNAAVGT
jgi:quercetin dioxygenase-like cupin family protein